MKRLFLLTLLPVLALAQTAPPANDELDALNVADQAPAKVEQASDWHTFVEAAYGDTQQRYGLPSYQNGRLSIDATLDKTLAPGWRLVFADRLDWDWQSETPDQAKINTLKELYLSWHISSDKILDVGRINTRYGVATGYNPTDYFRDDAVRSVVSINPSSLRNNRLGSVMLRGQTLWNGGSLTALFSPKLEPDASSEPFNVDLGATNRVNRYLLVASQQVSDSFNPQVLLYGEQGKLPQMGLDLTRLFGDATVAFFEWSGGRSASEYAQALGGPEREAFHNRLSTGFTYSTDNKISLTLEAEYDGAALDKANWNALPFEGQPRYVQYRTFVQAAQDLPTREALFAYASWQDAGVTHLDLTALLRQDMSDQSRLTWAEARYHWDHVDLALQWQRYGGKPWSDFGVLPGRTSWQTVATYYF
ncbi:MAG: hypothetical protein JO002_03800 [Burkholderiaceae bacterium]|nr:hypothetical protein [Burkholderiaceae bacterium]